MPAIFPSYKEIMHNAEGEFEDKQKNRECVNYDKIPTDYGHTKIIKSLPRLVCYSPPSSSSGTILTSSRGIICCLLYCIGKTRDRKQEGGDRKWGLR